MSPKYTWTSGYYSRGIKAEVAARELKRLAKRGEVTAPRLVDASRSEDAPLHSAFEWNDATAGEEWRKAQARCLIHSLRVIESEESPPERVFFHVRVPDKAEGYVTKARVMGDEELRQQLMRQALCDLRGARDRYRELDELTPVWDALSLFDAA